MIRRPPRSTLFPYTNALPICYVHREMMRLTLQIVAKTLLDADIAREAEGVGEALGDRKSTRLNSSHANISYAVFCLKKKKKNWITTHTINLVNTAHSQVHQQ